jgi:hypothetical protein
MLTRLSIRRFKRLEEAEIELGRNVVFVGPNNSGKTSALQALSLWHLGLTQWLNAKADGGTARQRTGVTINRKDLFSIPIPHTNLLWKNLHTRQGKRSSDGKTSTDNILIRIGCEGVLGDIPWNIAFEFDYANSESLFCRPCVDVLTDDHIHTIRLVANQLKVAFLPPMSGLATEEPLLPAGRINVLIGQGRTAEVLRNLCYSVAGAEVVETPEWREVCDTIQRLFGVDLDRPEFDSSRGELKLTYRTAQKTSGERKRFVLDISSAGRGLQQTLLLLTYLHAFKNSTILLDEPDAHLEVLRQRQTYDLITSVAAQTGSQIIAATHSEIVLNEAAGRDTVIAFLGKPHRINDRGAQVRKSLLSVGYEHYMHAEARKWVLYLEGSTDAAILERLAMRLKHPAMEALSGAYVDYLDTNDPPLALNKFHALREAVPTLQGLAIFDRLQRELPADPYLGMIAWKRREIENYICTPESLLAWAAADGIPDTEVDLVEQASSPGRREAMQRAMNEVTDALTKLGKPSPWQGDLKVSEEFLEPVFAAYHRHLGLPESLMRKKQFYELADFLPLDQFDEEIGEKLDAIWKVFEDATRNAASNEQETP